MTLGAPTSPDPGTVVLTGSSSGIGLATAEAFLDDGWSVVGLDISPAPEGVTSRDGFSSYVVDVTETEAVAGALASIAPVVPTALVNAAGMYPATYFGSTDVDTYRRIFDLNVWGTVTTTQEFTRVCADGASIVNIASRDAYVPQANQFIYGASKAAISHLTQATAQALLPRDIRVNAVSPPRVATEALRAIYGEMPTDAVPVDVITSVILELATRGSLAGLNGRVLRVPAHGEIEL